MNTLLPASKSKRPRGFTLVETAIAMGLLSFGLLALIGLMPSGLGILRDSNQQTLETAMLRQISSHLAVVGFTRNEFGSDSGSTLYFNEEGQLLPDSEGARYLARLEDESPSLPGVSPGTDLVQLRNSLKRIKVSISRLDIPNPEAKTYSLQVAYR